MKNKKIISLLLLLSAGFCTVCGITVANCIGAPMFNGLKGEAASHKFTLNSSEQPDIVGTTGTLVYNSSCTVNYTNASNEAGYHVVLGNGGTISKGESRGLTSIKAVFTGTLRVKTSYEANLAYYFYDLTSGTEKTIVGDYFTIEALADNTKITSVEVTYSCEVRSNALVGALQEDTFNGTEDPMDKTPQYQQPIVKSYRGVGSNTYDSLFRYDMTNVLGDSRYDANVKDNADAKIHFLVTVDNGTTLGSFDLSKVKMHIKAYDWNTYKYSESGSTDWIKNVKWGNRNGSGEYKGVGHDQMIPAKSVDVGQTFPYELKYDYSTYQFEIIVNYSYVKAYVNPTNKYLTMCLDSFETAAFCPNYVAKDNTTGGMKIPGRVFVTY